MAERIELVMPGRATSDLGWCRGMTGRGIVVRLAGVVAGSARAIGRTTELIENAYLGRALYLYISPFTFFFFLHSL